MAATLGNEQEPELEVRSRHLGHECDRPPKFSFSRPHLVPRRERLAQVEVRQREPWLVFQCSPELF